MEEVRTIVVTLTGRDRPGVTAALTEALSAHQVELLDVEQIVVRQRLVLALLLTGRDVDAVEAVARGVAASLGMEVELTPGTAEEDPTGRARRGRLVVTVLGSPLLPQGLCAVTRTIATVGANIDRITRVAAYPVTAIELQVSGADLANLRIRLAAVAREAGVDVAVQRADLDRRGTHLVVMDVDSTLIQDEVVELLARHAGCEDEVAAITARAMNGELDFEESLRARVALLAGLHDDVLDKVRREITLTPGARTLVRTLKRLGYRVAIVSGGFSQIVTPLAAELGIDHARANTLEVEEGRLTGRLVGRIVDRQHKADALVSFARHHQVPLSRTIAVGDGANDLDMLEVAGLGIAFNAKPVVRDAADTAVNVPYLDSVLYLLGITREMVEEADSIDGPDDPDLG